MTKEMNVLIDASGVGSLGGVVQVRSLMRSLGTKQRYIVTLIASSEVVDGCESINLTNNINLRVIKKENISAIKKNKFFWSGFIDHKNYDRIIICNGIYIGPRKNVYLILQNQLPFHFSEVLRYFPSWFFFKFFLLFILFCLSSTFCDYVVFVSDSSKKFISKNILFRIFSWRAKKIVNHISIDEIYPIDEVGELKSFLPEQLRFTGVYLASIERYRNHEALADALFFLNSETDLNLRVVCAGPANVFVRRKIAQKKVEESLIFIDMIPKNEIETLVQRFDVGFYLSSCETFGLGLIEKVLRGIPTVVLKTPVSVELLGPNYPFFVENLLPFNIAKVCRMALRNRSRKIIEDFNDSQLRIKQFNNVLTRSQMEKYV